MKKLRKLSHVSTCRHNVSTTVRNVSTKRHNVSTYFLDKTNGFSSIPAKMLVKVRVREWIGGFEPYLRQASTHKQARASTNKQAQASKQHKDKQRTPTNAQTHVKTHTQRTHFVFFVLATCAPRKGLPESSPQPLEKIYWKNN